MKKFILFLILPFFLVSLVAQEAIEETVEEGVTTIEVLNDDETVDTVITIVNPDTFPNDLTIVNVGVWFFNNWDRILSLFIGFLTIVEVFLRAVKTKANLSILAAISRFLDNAKLINLLTSNRRKSGGVFKTTEKVVK